MVVVVIGNYNQASPIPSIEGASKEYYSVVRAFNYVRGYDIVFATNNGIKHMTKKNSFKRTKKIKSFDFKLSWVNDDVENFNQHIVQKILPSANNDTKMGTNRYDSLIYILSSHGDGDKAIYDSNGEEIPLEYIYYTFNNQNCKTLRQRPKIYMCDINRVGSDSCTPSRCNRTQLQQSESKVNNHNNCNTDNVDSKNDEELQSIPDADHGNNQQNLMQQLPVVDTKTYTAQSHCCAIFGNSKHQPLQIAPNNINVNDDCSLFVDSITKVVSSNFTFVNSSLGDVLFETRQNMANALSLQQKKEIKLGDVVLKENSTMPYDIKFASSACVEANSNDEKESKVCFG